MRLEMLEMAGEVGVKWTCRKATERVYAVGKGTEGVEDGSDSDDMEEERDVHDPGKYRGITLLSQVLKLLERVLDARIRRREGR